MVKPGVHSPPGNPYPLGNAPTPGSPFTNVGRVAKRFALYPPKGLMQKLGLKEGQKVRYEMEGGKLVVELLPNPIDLALNSKKWARTSARELEKLSEKEQAD